MSYDVIIAGLGAMGSSAAWQLARRGVNVLGFDRFHPPHTMGSSTGRSRIIREAYWESPFYVPLVRRAYELWEDLGRARGGSLLRRTGGLIIGSKEGDLVSGAIRSADEHEVPYQVLEARQVRERYPFRPDGALVGVLEPRAGVLQPEECVAAMLAEGAAHGAELHFDEPLERWEALGGGDGVRVFTARGTFEAQYLILAVGAWMSGNLPGLPAQTLPLSVARQTMYWIRPLPGSVWGADSCPVWLWETPQGPVYYGFPDLGDGPKVARHHGGEVVNPDQVNRQVAEGESSELRRFLEEAIPSLSGTVEEAQVCLYTNTPDEHFILDRHPEHFNVLLVSPCSGHGFKFAPTVGEILADACQGAPPRYDLEHFRLERFLPGDVL